MPTRTQLALIHVARKELGLDEERYRDILAVETGKDSARDLDAAGVDRVLSRFKEMGFTPGHLPGGRRRTSSPPESRASPHDPDELPTPGQMAKISHLWEDIGWPEAQRRQDFARRQCNGHPWPQTRQEASDLMEALKAMVRRGYSARVPRSPRAPRQTRPR